MTALILIILAVTAVIVITDHLKHSCKGCTRDCNRMCFSADEDDDDMPMHGCV